MLIGTYDPRCKAKCPNCGFVNCLNEAGNLSSCPRYLELRHLECGAKWRLYLDTNEIEIISKQVIE